MQVYLCAYEIGNKRFNGDKTFIIKKLFYLNSFVQKKKVCYIYRYVSDFLQKSLTDLTLV